MVMQCFYFHLQISLFKLISGNGEAMDSLIEMFLRYVHSIWTTPVLNHRLVTSVALKVLLSLLIKWQVYLSIWKVTEEGEIENANNRMSLP